MTIRCLVCGYDSGDHPDNKSLFARVNSDGGHAMLEFDEYGKPAGLELACPNGHDGEDITLE